MMQERFDVAIIGAGIIGCAVAYYTAKSGKCVALLEKGRIACEATSAAAGMLAPLAEPEEIDGQLSQPNPFQQLFYAALTYYDTLDQQLKDETGMSIDLMKVPTLRPAFDEHEANALQAVYKSQHHLLPGLSWLNQQEALEIEPLLSPQIQGALFSSRERNVQGARVALAYARGAALQKTQIFEGRLAQQFIYQRDRVIGVGTDQGPLYADQVVLATGAWSSRWSGSVSSPIYPIKGQMLSLRVTPQYQPRHTIYHHQVGCILPKADGSIYVGASSEDTGFDQSVTINGIKHILGVVDHLAPELGNARFEQSWAGLRPHTIDGLPLIGPSQQRPGLWVASGHARDGILLGPITGHILAELMMNHPAPHNLSLDIFDPDRFGEWV
jgi:glycine oxidase